MAESYQYFETVHIRQVLLCHYSEKNNKPKHIVFSKIPIYNLLITKFTLSNLLDVREECFTDTLVLVIRLRITKKIKKTVNY